MMDLFSVLLVPLFGVLFSFTFSGSEKRTSFYFAFFSIVYSFIALSQVPLGVQETFSWLPFIGSEFGVMLDRINVQFLYAILILSAATLIFASREIEEAQGTFFSLFLLVVVGLLGIAMSTNLIQFYLFWEISVIPAFFILSRWGHGAKAEIRGTALKYFVYMHVGALFMLVGFLLLGSEQGTFTIPLLSPSVVSLPFYLMVFGFLVKMGAFPTHNWLPAAHSRAPTPLSAMLSGLMIKAGVYGLLRIILTVYNVEFTWLFILGIASMLYGSVLAILQEDLKRVLAFSSISQIGYMLFGIGLFTSQSIAGANSHLFNHALAKGLLFLCAGSIIYCTGKQELGALKGLMKKMPVTSVCFAIAALSLAGVPPLGGFFSESMIFSEITEPLVLLGVAVSFLTPVYFLWILKNVFYEGKPSKIYREEPIEFKLSMTVLSVLILLSGVIQI